MAKKLFFLGKIDREDGGYIGARIALEKPDNIETYPDAIEYFKNTLSSDEFIRLMYEADCESWLDEISEYENLTLEDFKLESVKYAGGFCRWTFYSLDENYEIVVDKSMDFITQFIL